MEYSHCINRKNIYIYIYICSSCALILIPIAYMIYTIYWNQMRFSHIIHYLIDISFELPKRSRFFSTHDNSKATGINIKYWSIENFKPGYFQFHDKSRV